MPGEIDWTRPDVWSRVLGFTLLFSVAVACGPAAIGMIVARLLTANADGLELLTLGLSAALMSCFVITLWKPDMQKSNSGPYSSLKRLSQWEGLAIAGWLLPTGVIVALVGAVLDRTLMLGFDHTKISIYLVGPLYLMCIGNYLSRLATPAGDDSST